jgi:hypothetical protein
MFYSKLCRNHANYNYSPFYLQTVSSWNQLKNGKIL